MVCELPDRPCLNDSNTCIKVSNLCNDRKDCADGSDEGGVCGKTNTTRVEFVLSSRYVPGEID